VNRTEDNYLYVLLTPGQIRPIQALIPYFYPEKPVTDPVSTIIPSGHGNSLVCRISSGNDVRIQGIKAILQLIFFLIR